MKRKYRFILRIKFDYHLSDMVALKQFISIAHRRCSQDHKFYLSKLMHKENWYLFFNLYGQGVDFKISEMIHYEKKDSD